MKPHLQFRVILKGSRRLTIRKNDKNTEAPYSAARDALTPGARFELQTRQAPVSLIILTRLVSPRLALAPITPPQIPSSSSPIENERIDLHSRLLKHPRIQRCVLGRAFPPTGMAGARLAFNDGPCDPDVQNRLSASEPFVGDAEEDDGDE